MKKNIIIKLVCSLIILLLTTIILATIIYSNNYNEIENISWEYWKGGDNRRGGKVINYVQENNLSKEYVLFSIGIDEAVSQIIYISENENYNRNPAIEIETLYLKRSGINTFQVKSSILSTTSGAFKYSFEDIINLAKKQDIYKNNPDPEKIINRPDVNLTQKKIEENIARTDEEEYFERSRNLRERLLQASPQEKLIIIEQREKDLTQFIDTGIYPYTGERFGDGAIQNYKAELEYIRQERIKILEELSNEK